MEDQTIQDALKSDLMTIPTLNLGIISARDLYGSIAMFVFKLSLIFLCVNTANQLLLHVVGLYYPSPDVSVMVQIWGYAMVGSVFIGIVLSPFILFSKMVKGQLKSEAFIKIKFIQFTRIYFIIYSVAYIFLLISADSGTYRHEFFNPMEITFNLIFSQFGSLVGAMVAVNFIANIEIERLGIGAVFNIVKQFVEKLKNQPSTDSNSKTGSDSNAR